MDYTLGLRVKDLPTFLPSYFGFKTNHPKDALLGMEFEIEGDRLPNNEDLRYHWNVEHDGSLRGNSAEYVLKKPISVAYFKEKAFPYLTKMVTRKKSSLKISGRCSTHVHVNVQELYLYQVIAMAALYHTFEPAAMALVKTGRSGNLFCVGANNTEFIVEELLRCALSDTVNMVASDRKYAAVNLTSIQKFGSLEFRALQGTLSSDEVYTWVHYLIRLRKYCLALTLEDFGNIMHQMSADRPSEFLGKILGKKSKAYRRILSAVDNDTQQLSYRIYEGLNSMQRVFYEPPWDTLPLREDGMTDKDYFSILAKGDIEDVRRFYRSIAPAKQATLADIIPKGKMSKSKKNLLDGVTIVSTASPNLRYREQLYSDPPPHPTQRRRVTGNPETTAMEHMRRMNMQEERMMRATGNARRRSEIEE